MTQSLKQLKNGVLVLFPSLYTSAITIMIAKLYVISRGQGEIIPPTEIFFVKEKFMNLHIYSFRAPQYIVRMMFLLFLIHLHL